MAKKKEVINPLDIPGQRPKVLKIDPEIQKLLTPLAREEYDLLEQSILAEGGCRQPLFLWLNSGVELDDTILLDGHHRYEICHRHTLWFPTTGKDFPSREAAIEWVKINQLARRNLTEEAKKYLMGGLHNTGKRDNSANLKQNLPSVQNAHSVSGDNDSIKTSEKLAKEFGVNESTIRRAAKFAEAVDTLTEAYGQEIKNKILSGEAKVPIKSIVEIAKMEPERQKEEVQKIMTDHPAEKKFAPSIVPKQEVRETPKEQLQEMLTMPRDLKAISKMLLANFKVEELRQMFEMILGKVN